MSQLSAKITADISGYRKSIQDAKNVLKGFTKAESETAETLKKVYDVTNDQVNAYKKVTDSMLKATDGTKTIKQASNQLKNDIEKLKIQWANLSEAARNSKFGQSMANSIRTAEAQLKSMQSTMGATQAVTTSASSSLSSIVSIVGKFAPAIAVGTTALNTLKDVFFASESNIDEWGRTVEGAKGAYNVFLDALNSGSWSGFFDRIGRANKEMRDLYDLYDKAGSTDQNNKAAIALQESVVERLRLEMAQGKDVKKQLDEADARLRKLKMEGVSARKEAGYQGVVTALGSGGADESVRKKVADEFLKIGESYRAMAERYVAQMEQVVKQGRTAEVATNQYGGTKTVKIEDDVRLVDTLGEDKKQLYLAYKALVSKESNQVLTDGMNAYTQALRDEAAIDKSSRKIANATVKGGNSAKAKSVELDEKWLNDDVYEELPAYIAKQNEEFSKLTRTYTFGVDEIISANLAAHASTVEFLSTWDKGELADGMLNSLGSINSSLSSVYDTMKGIGDLDNPFKVFDALINTATNVKNVVDTMQNLGTMMKTIGAINKAETANAIAMDQAKIASNQAETASSVGAASAETMAAHASIPFAGIAIATAAIGAMIAVLASTKNKVPKFANGGIISGPTLGLMGEYSGAANNPEVVAPLDKLRTLIGDNDTSYNVRFEIEARKLVGVLEKENRLNSRR